MHNDDNVLRASKLDTTALSDAMDRLGIGGQCLGIKPLDPGFRLTGRAFTILYGPAGMPPGTVGDYIDDVEPGGVVVLDNGGRENATVWGDILTMVAHTRGVAGTVIDGACRDVALVARAGLSDLQPQLLHAHRQRSRAGGGDGRAGKHRRRASRCGRYSARRRDGIVALPRAHESAILAAAEEIDAVEERIRHAVQSRPEPARGSRAARISQAADQGQVEVGCKPAGRASGALNTASDVIRGWRQQPVGRGLRTPSIEHPQPGRCMASWAGSDAFADRLDHDAGGH